MKYQHYEETYPRVINIQLDNCYRENKNMVFFGMVSALIKLDLAAEITLTYLPSGHTHENIDQKFSIMRRWMLRNSILDPVEDIVNSFKKAYKSLYDEGKLHLYNYEDLVVFDWKYWLRNSTPILDGHSRPLYFKFFKEKTIVMITAKSTIYSKKSCIKGGAQCIKFLEFIPIGHIRVVWPNKFLDQEGYVY